MYLKSGYGNEPNCRFWNKNVKQKQARRPHRKKADIDPAICGGGILCYRIPACPPIYFPPQNPFYKIALLWGLRKFISRILLFSLPSLNKSCFAWRNAVISGIAIGGLLFVPEIDHRVFNIIASYLHLVASRGPSYFLVIGAFVLQFVTHLNDERIPNHQWIIHLGLVIAALVAIETIQQLKKIAREQINRLEIINELSKQIVSTLATKQVFSLLNAAFQNALEADAYYIGIVNEDDLHLELLYDDGEFFENVNIKRKGSLANRDKNQRNSSFQIWAKRSTGRCEMIIMANLNFLMDGRAHARLPCGWDHGNIVIPAKRL
jgi:hypothetical protein